MLKISVFVAVVASLVSVVMLASRVVNLQNEMQLLKSQTVEKSQAMPTRQEEKSTPDDKKFDSSRRESLSRRQNSFQAETLDTAWSKATQGQIASAMADKTVALHPQKIECRSNTCRIDIATTDLKRLSTVIPYVSMKLAGSLKNMVADVNDDAAVLYFSR